VIIYRENRWESYLLVHNSCIDGYVLVDDRNFQRNINNAPMLCEVGYPSGTTIKILCISNNQAADLIGKLKRIVPTCISCTLSSRGTGDGKDLPGRMASRNPHRKPKINFVPPAGRSRRRKVDYPLKICTGRNLSLGIDQFHITRHLSFLFFSFPLFFFLHESSWSTRYNNCNQFSFG